MNERFEKGMNAVGNAIRMTAAIDGKVLAHFCASPGAAYEIVPLSASDVRALREEVMRSDFAVQVPAAAEVVSRFVELVSVCMMVEGFTEEQREAVYGLSEEDLEGEGITVEGVRAMADWAASVRGDGLMDEEASHALFAALGDLSVLPDEFERRDCVDRAIDTFEANENLKALVMEPSASFVIR